MKKLNLILSLLFVISLSSCASGDKKKKAGLRSQAFLHQDIGMGYLKGKNYPAALKQLITANKLAPNEPSIMNNLAIAYHYRGRSDLAYKTLQKILRQDPKYTEARTNLGQILIEQKKYSQAVKQLRIARKDLTYPNPEKVHANLGIAYFHLANHKGAKKELDLALKVNREYCLALFFKVKNMYYRKKYMDSAQLADRTELTCPGGTTPEMIYLSGMGRFMMGQNDAAKNRFSKLIKAYPTSEFSKKAKLAISTIEMD